MHFLNKFDIFIKSQSHAGVAQLVERCLAFGKGKGRNCFEEWQNLAFCLAKASCNKMRQKNNCISYAGVAQLVERCLAKAKVAGSNPVFRSTQKLSPCKLTFYSKARADRRNFCLCGQTKMPKAFCRNCHPKWAL